MHRGLSIATMHCVAAAGKFDTMVPVVAALNAGGHRVAHSAGGLIVYSATTGGYVAGTYVSTAALASFLTGSAVAAGALGTAAVGGAAIWAYGTVAGAAASLVGGAGFFGTAIGATGATGLLMSWGLLPSVPVFVPVLIGIASISATFLVGAGVYYAVSVRRLRKKVISAPADVEVQFTSRDAKVAEKMLRNVAKPHICVWRIWMRLFGSFKPAS